MRPSKYAQWIAITTCLTISTHENLTQADNGGCCRIQGGDCSTTTADGCQPTEEHPIVTWYGGRVCSFNRCVKGISCFKCVGGSSPGQDCENDSECPGGSCDLTLLQVGPAGYEFPDDFAGNARNSRAAGSMFVSVKLDNPSLVVKTRPGFPIATTNTETGRTVALLAAKALCDAAEAAPGITCFSTTSPGTCAAFLGPPSGPVTVACTTNASGTGNGFSITQSGPGTVDFFLSLNGTSKLSEKNGLELERVGDPGTSSAGILASFNFRLVPNGNNGVVTFNTSGAPGGVGSNPFTVNTTGKTDLQLHTEICDKYAAIGIPTILHTPPDTADFVDTTSVTGGYSIESFNPPSVVDFIVTPVAGQTVVSQLSGSNATAASAVPALSEWGMIALVALLVLSGIWMLRRRQRLQSS